MHPRFFLTHQHPFLGRSFHARRDAVSVRRWMLFAQYTGRILKSRLGDGRHEVFARKYARGCRKRTSPAKIKTGFRRHARGLFKQMPTAFIALGGLSALVNRPIRWQHERWGSRVQHAYLHPIADGAWSRQHKRRSRFHSRALKWDAIPNAPTRVARSSAWDCFHGRGPATTVRC